MGFSAKIIADSLSPGGCRLATVEATYPRFIHSEILTHRDRARNSASSRAIPWEHKPGSSAKTKSMKEMILTEPVMPIRFGSEQRGMQTGGEIENPQRAEEIWLKARDQAVASAQALADLGVHKSICNRLTEPFMWITVVMTATSWKNFFRLRVHPDAEIHFQKIAGMVKDVLDAGEPRKLRVGDWHLPYISDDELRGFAQTGDPGVWEYAAKISTARCARVSYLTHDGKRDMAKDLELFEKLVQGSGFGHMSPHEHPAMAATPDVRSGPYRGFIQFRKFFPNECADAGGGS